MKKVLQINTSLHGQEATSTILASKLALNLALNQQANVIKRDVGALDIPHLTAEQHAGFGVAPEARSLSQRYAVELSDTLIGELRDSDTIVLGLPLYNFGIPSAFKAWIDHVARAGETFNYTATGPEGTLTGKKVYVVATRGGKYAGTEADLQTPYIRQVLGFLGLDDVEFIYAEGLAMSDQRDAAIDAANSQIRQIAA